MGRTTLLSKGSPNRNDRVFFYQMSYSLNSRKWGYIGDYIGDIEWDTRSLDYSSSAIG